MVVSLLLFVVVVDNNSWYYEVVVMWLIMIFKIMELREIFVWCGNFYLINLVR